MYSIDMIMDMLDWHNDSDIQGKGRELAKDIRCVNVFLQPLSKEHNKNVWHNCAEILAKRPDSDLKPYLHKLFEWLYDMNCPGASCIWGRLLRYDESDWVNTILDMCINEAKALNEEVWLNNLLEFQKQKGSNNTNNNVSLERDITIDDWVSAGPASIWTQTVKPVSIKWNRDSALYSIDEIMEMLDWHNDSAIQEKGCQLAKDIRCINVFMQPGGRYYEKNVWDNCAKILAKRPDSDLEPYLYQLFEWLLDMNWPGAFCIWKRLLRYGKSDWYDKVLNACINKSKAIDEEIWLNNLLEFQKQRLSSE